MDFSQFLEDYMTAKRLKGVTPTKGQSAALFAPYFDKQFAANQTGRRLDIAERSQAFNEKRAGESLAWGKQKFLDDLALEKWRTQQMMDLAGKQDTQATIGNVVSSGAALGNLALLKKFGYFDRRY
jgi:hypothetical protein